MTPERLEQLARPDAVLLETEQHRREEFLRLFAEVLGDAVNPTVTQVVAARARAAAVWRYDRLSDTGAFYQERVVGACSAKLGRREEFADTDHRSRLRAHLLDELEQANALMEAIGLAPVPVDRTIEHLNRERVT